MFVELTVLSKNVMKIKIVLQRNVAVEHTGVQRINILVWKFVTLIQIVSTVFGHIAVAIVIRRDIVQIPA